MESVQVEEPKSLSDIRPRMQGFNGISITSDVTFIDAVFERMLNYSVEDLSTVLMQNPEIIHCRAWHGMTILHKLCMRGDAAVITTLLQYGADPNVKNDNGETPVHYACRKGQLPSVMALLKGGGDAAILDNRGHNGMHYAAQGGAIAVLVFLHESCDLEYNVLSAALQSPLHVAALHGQWQTVAFLLRNQRCDVGQVDIMGNTALHLAALKGHLSICWQIVSRGGAKCLLAANSQNQTPVDAAKENTTTMRYAGTSQWLKKFSEQYSRTGSVPPPRSCVAFCFLFPLVIGYIAPMALCWVIDRFHMLCHLVCVAVLVHWIMRQDHRLLHPCRWPNPARAGILLWGLLGNIINYFYYLKPYLRDHWLIAWLSWTCLFAVLLSLITFFRVNSGRFKYEEVPYRARDDGKQTRDWNVIVQRSSNHNFCDECELIQPDGVRHCRMCGACYWSMDHHCLFLMRCVTASNAKYFLAFLFSLLSGCLAYCTNFVSYLNLLKRTSETSSSVDILQQMIITQPFLLVMLVADLFGILWCGVLAIHTFQAATRKHGHSHSHNIGMLNKFMI